MASGRGAEELCERPEACPAGPSCEQPACKADGVHDWPSQPCARQSLRLTIDKGKIEACVVGDEHRVAGELEKAAHGHARMRLTAELRVVQAGQGTDRSAERNAGVDKQLELLGELEIANPYRPDLADARGPGAQARRLEIHHDEGRVLDQDVCARRIGKPHRLAAPDQPGVVADDLVEQAPGEADGSVAEGEEPPSRLLGVDRSPPFLDQLDEPVRRIQPELHDERVGEHTFDGKTSHASRRDP